jgi:hypothetical protein
LDNIVKLSELPMDTKLFIENSDYDVEIIDKHDFLWEIQASWRDYISDIHTIYIAEPNPLKLDVRWFLSDLLERYEDDQYEDWAQDMYDDLEDSPAVIQFVEQFNKTAAGRVTYYPGKLVNIDIELYNEDGSRIQNIVED